MVPAHRNSKSKSRRRRANQALKPETLGVCFNCKAPRLPHKACIQCGDYNAPIKPKKPKKVPTQKEAPKVEVTEAAELPKEAEETPEVPEAPLQTQEETQPETKTEDSE